MNKWLTKEPSYKNWVSLAANPFRNRGVREQ